MSSVSPPPSAEPAKPTKQNKNSKKKSSSSKLVTVVEHGKDEGTNPEWDYVPPDGTILVDHHVDCEDFDWDAVKDNDDFELWLVRVPEDLKPKYLENVGVDVRPSSSHSAKAGELKRKHVSYDIWSLGDDNEQQQSACGEEIRGISCLLPRKKKHGKLYKAPKPITRHFVISAQNALSTPDPSISLTSDSSRTYQNPPRHSYPKELLKHCFMPYGSVSRNADDDIDVEVNVGKEKGKGEASPMKGKKRKGEGESPKKSKKVKTDA